MAILLNAVRVRGNNQHSILHKHSTTASFVICTQYIPSLYLVCTCMYWVYTMYFHKINQSAANLWIEGMEAPLWEIERIASCTHQQGKQPVPGSALWGPGYSDRELLEQYDLQRGPCTCAICQFTSTYWYVLGTYQHILVTYQEHTKDSQVHTSAFN